MAKAENIQRLGEYLRDLRKERGWTLTEAEVHLGVKMAYLSNIERGYANPGRPPTVPSDHYLELFAKGYGIPLVRFYEILGRIPPVTYNITPESFALAEAYERLPPMARRIVDSAMKSAVQLAADMERQGMVVAGMSDNKDADG